MLAEHLLLTGLKLDMDMFDTLLHYVISRFDKDLNKEVAIKVIDLEEA